MLELSQRLFLCVLKQVTAERCANNHKSVWQSNWSPTVKVQLTSYFINTIKIHKKVATELLITRMCLFSTKAPSLSYLFIWSPCVGCHTLRLQRLLISTIDNFLSQKSNCKKNVVDLSRVDCYPFRDPHRMIQPHWLPCGTKLADRQPWLKSLQSQTISFSALN